MTNWKKNPHSSTPITLQDIDVWTADRIRKSCDITITDGFVTDIRPTASQGRRKRRIAIMPSAVDTQVHLRTPGQWTKETPETGLHAALKGGVGSLLTMPNTKPVLDSVDALMLAKAQIAAAELRYGIRVMYSVAGTIGQNGKVVAPIEELVANGAAAVTDDGKGISDDQVQLLVFEAAARSGAPFMQHAETLGAEGPLADGPVPRALGLKPYGSHHETDMVARDIKLLEKVPTARYHLLHTSAAKSLPLVLAAKEKGLRVTAEVSPHHLYFSSSEIDAQNKSFKMNPPIRSSYDREALIDALRDGLIDWVATDHAPHEAETKQKPFSEASFGTLGLETMVPVVLDLVAKGRLSATRAVQVLSSAPAKFLGIDSEFGFIKIGSPARLTIVAPDESWTVHASEHVSLSKNTCFDGIRLTGKVLGQINRSGTWLAEDI
ncbi:MAG: dihydroorotase family protein [Deltaproteobacteria bacterium]|jgi:dihydroorotase|nr:dihydroorotase family protein [Deltaproteobacteria bacterium]